MAYAQHTRTSTASEQEIRDASTILNNHNLFSSYYLGTLLQSEVRQLQGETGMQMPRSVRNRLQARWERHTGRLGTISSYRQTREAWLETLFIALGYEPLEAAQAEEFKEETLPDGYFVYRPALPVQPASPPQAQQASLLSQYDTDEQESDADDISNKDHAVLISLLSWGTDFDRAFATHARRSQGPHTLMERLLASGGPARWGILCNGRSIRLLRRDVIAGRQQYFEVDLEALFDESNAYDREQAMNTFWTLFRAPSFHLSTDGRCLLDVLDQRSRDHAEGVSKELKKSVFNALDLLMKELVNHARELVNQPGKSAQEQRRGEQAQQALEQLPTLYKQSLVYLYRLLFVLYAESRNVLPVDNAIYRDSYSLHPLRQEIQEPNRQTRYQPNSYRLWETIQALYRLIHWGCNTTQLVVPAYNGNLFDLESTSYLNAIRLSDRALANILLQLSVTQTKERGLERIDYRDLGVEQLGAVYEGLLEFEPHIAKEAMVEVTYKGTRVILPERDKCDYKVERFIAEGEFYLGRGAGRKTSGSYYTPQKLVDFLVRRTLDPLVEGKTSAQILELKIVDPAMGSGAFLIGACLYLADAYTRALRREAQAEEHSELRSSAPYDDLPSDLYEEEELDEEATRPYRRLVAERCLYGVDLNEMAVELAKVSLWLTTLAGDKPLTFLDANLRCGNSLIGAPLRPYQGASGRTYTLEHMHPEANKRLLKMRGTKASNKKSDEATMQLSLFEQDDLPQTLEPLVDTRRKIAEMPSDTVANIHEKAQFFRRYVEQSSQRNTLKTICDLWIASWFWHQPPKDAKPSDPNWVPPLDAVIYRQLIQQLRGEQKVLAESMFNDYMQACEKVIEQVKPFHWELEFPEVYFTSNGRVRENAGFDAVLGNPPWDIVKPNSQEFFSAFDPEFRELERAVAEKRQEELLKEFRIRTTWDFYTKELDSQVDYMRLSEAYPHQSIEIDGKQTRGDINTYKLFLERAFDLLRTGGASGIIVPSGIYTDQGCTGLRQLFFRYTHITSLICFENRRGIFPIDSRFKFVLFGFRKQPTVEAFDAGFMLQDLEVLASPKDHSLSVPSQLIQRFSPDTLSIMEFRSQQDVDIVARIYSNHPLLGEDIKGTWSINLAREFHMTDDRPLFNENDLGWPLYEGKMLHQYTHHYSEPRYWVEPSKGIDELARIEIQRLEEALDAIIQSNPRFRNYTTRKARIAAFLKENGRGPFTPNDVKIAVDVPRISYRDIARNTDERTMISTILPAHVFEGNTLFFVIPLQIDIQKALVNLNEIKSCYSPSLPAVVMAYVCGVFNSFTLDYVLRFKVSVHVNMFYVYQLPVPRLTATNPHCHAIAHRVAQLVCIGPEFDDLRSELLGSVEAHVATNPIERQKLQNEIDALVAHLYELHEEDLRHILYAPYPFPLVKRYVKDGVMAAFARVEQLLQPFNMI